MTSVLGTPPKWAKAFSRARRKSSVVCVNVGSLYAFAAVAQHDPKDVRLPPLAVGSDDRRARAEIDLGFFAGTAFHPAERKRRARPDRARTASRCRSCP